MAIDAVIAASQPHSFLGVHKSGQIAMVHTAGNPDGHVILRGGRGAPNSDAEGIEAALELLRAAGLPERLVVDASHDNSGKDPVRQVAAAEEIGAQVAAGNGAIAGVMLESFLVEGRQDLEGGEPLVYGQSITDACIDWEATVSLLDTLAESARSRREA